MADDKPWGHPAEGPTFNEKYPTEFRPSGVPNAGNGWWARVDIPKGTRMRRVSIADGTLKRVGSLQELEAAGWDIDDAVNYGSPYKKDSGAIYFMNPGTACNHSDPTRECSIVYKFDDEEGVVELFTIRDVKAGEEMFNNYSDTFGPCKWFDELQNSRGNTTLFQLGSIIDHKILNVKPAPKGSIEMKVTLRKSAGFYANSARSFLKGVEAKEATGDKDALEAKPPVSDLRISGVGEACNVAVAAASDVARDGSAFIKSIQTCYLKISGISHPQIVIDMGSK